VDEPKSIFCRTVGSLFAAPNVAIACDYRKGRVLLLGDSIFDNDRYVTGKSVIDHFNERLFASCLWDVKKRAVDGDKVEHVLSRLPENIAQFSDIFLSVGGNDALAHREKLAQVSSAEDLSRILIAPVSEFKKDYESLLNSLVKIKARVTVCTIYTAIPFGNEKWETYVPIALRAYNQVIVEAAEKYGMDVLRLEEICTQPEDFSSISPIEPSEIGGAKIVEAIIEKVMA